jgi:hypothetical protein
MNHTFLNNLLLALTIFSAVFILAFTASGQGTTAEKPPETGGSQAVRPSVSGSASTARTDTDGQAEINSMRIRTGLGVVMELSTPLEVSCERMSALEKMGQGKPAEVKSGTTVSGTTTTGQATRSEASQITIPSHGRMLTLEITGDKVLVSCDEASSHGDMQPSQPSGEQPARAQ